LTAIPISPSKPFKTASEFPAASPPLVPLVPDLERLQAAMVRTTTTVAVTRRIRVLMNDEYIAKAASQARLVD
jgi:hypothetical protein